MYENYLLIAQENKSYNTEVDDHLLSFQTQHLEDYNQMLGHT